ncbi:MAG: septum formation initiator family protein [Bacteroidetes bacterium]|jgi:cell division protein FtsB|nr:septum formation initiator family protein [Bacteroidota bacterium]
MNWKFWKRYPLLGNRFLLTGLAFGIYLFFFDANSILNIVALKSKEWALEKDEKYYQDHIAETQQRLEELSSNTDNLEKFARENHHMKRAGESVYVIVDRAELE